MASEVVGRRSFGDAGPLVNAGVGEGPQTLGADEVDCSLNDTVLDGGHVGTIYVVT